MYLLKLYLCKLKSNSNDTTVFVTQYQREVAKYLEYHAIKGNMSSILAILKLKGFIFPNDAIALSRSRTTGGEKQEWGQRKR